MTAAGRFSLPYDLAARGSAKSGHTLQKRMPFCSMAPRCSHVDLGIRRLADADSQGEVESEAHPFAALSQRWEAAPIVPR